MIKIQRIQFALESPVLNVEFLHDDDAIVCPSFLIQLNRTLNFIIITLMDGTDLFKVSSVCVVLYHTFAENDVVS